MKVGFFSNLKMGRSNHPQTLRPAFLVDFSGILQLKNTVLGAHRHPGNVYLVIWKVGMTHTYVSKNEEQTRGFVGRILKE